jgi:hypothetical protein
MAKVLLTPQYFGDGNTTSFDLPRALTAGYVLKVEVGGVDVPFTYSDADTIALATAPASGDIINMYEDNDLGFATSAGGIVKAYTKAATGVNTVLAAVAYDRVVLMSVEVTEVFANGDGAQPTFKIGQDSSDSKFSATGMLTSAAVTAKFALGGVLSAGKKLIVTATAGTGATETGAIEVSVIAAPVLPA